jgi:hypothetical protein
VVRRGAITPHTKEWEKEERERDRERDVLDQFNNRHGSKRRRRRG